MRGAAAVVLSVAVLLGACSGTDDATPGGPGATPGAAAVAGADGTGQAGGDGAQAGEGAVDLDGDGEPDATGDGSAPVEGGDGAGDDGVLADEAGPAAAPRFGPDVCTALLPALSGETVGLDPYATPEVLATLAEGAAPGAADAAVVTVDEPGTCTIGIGDTSVELVLELDAELGDHAVAAFWSVPGDVGPREPVTADGGGIAEDVAAYRQDPAACEGQVGPIPDGAPDHEVLEIDGVVVVAVLCETFAYQAMHELLAWDGDLRPIDVEQWQGELVVHPLVLGQPMLEDGMLVNVERGRGAGDCGTYQAWFVAGDALVLNEARVRECTDDGEFVDPRDWPLVYPDVS